MAVDFILSIMEIEAWFLAEHRHLQAVHSDLTVEVIAAALGFNPATEDMQLRPNPARDLNDCYVLGGKVYDKVSARTTVDALHFASVYVELVDKFPDLKLLCEIIEGFLKS